MNLDDLKKFDNALVAAINQAVDDGLPETLLIGVLEGCVAQRKFFRDCGFMEDYRKQQRQAVETSKPEAEA